MAAVSQYMMPSRNAEIAMARSAAPVGISRNATILVLGAHGYQTALKGSNGFVCLVERSWMSPFDSPEFWNPKIRGPICYNPPAVRTILPYTVNRTNLVLGGVSKPAPGAMSYMMSKTQYLADCCGHWHPHLMFNVPTTNAASWGANVDGSPVVVDDAHVDMPEGETIFMIPNVEQHRDLSPVAGPMRSGGMSVVCLAIVSDSPCHKVMPDGRIHPYRIPDPGELYHYGIMNFERLHDLIRREGLSVITDAKQLSLARPSNPSASWLTLRTGRTTW